MDMKAVKASDNGAVSDETRREVLKKFGRYAAAAPTVMVLLQSGRSEAAGKGKGKGKGDGPY